MPPIQVMQRGDVLIMTVSSSPDTQETRICSACGSPMVRDRALVHGPAGTTIVRVFWHCISRTCGHIIRISEHVEEGQPARA